MLAPDKGLATLPISIYGARHVDGHAADRHGWRARFGRRVALQIGTAFGVLDRA